MFSFLTSSLSYINVPSEVVKKENLSSFHVENLDCNFDEYKHAGMI